VRTLDVADFGGEGGGNESWGTVYLRFAGHPFGGCRGKSGISSLYRLEALGSVGVRHGPCWVGRSVAKGRVGVGGRWLL
jgi:hypothetical protein